MNTLRYKKNTLFIAVILLSIASILLGACAQPNLTPEVIEKVVTLPAEVIEQTKIVEATVIVEMVVTPTPVPPNLTSGPTLIMGVTAGGYGAAPISPIFCNGGWCWPMTHLTLPGLTILGDKGQVEPSLATGWESNETADVWTFTLDPNAKWSDGEPLTAADVYFTYHLGLNPATNSNWAQQAPGIETSIKGTAAYRDGTAETIEGIEIVDDQTIKFTMEQPNGVFDRVTWLGIMPEHILKDVPPAELSAHPFCAEIPTVTSGPYTYVRREGAEVFEVAKVADYWGKQVQFDTVIFKALNDDIAATQVQAGEVETGRIPPSEFARLDAEPHVRSILTPEVWSWYWMINQRKPYLQDKRVREALWMAMDPQAILDVSWEGLGTLSDTPAMAPDWVAVPELIDAVPFDPEGAKALLDEAGWDWNQKITIMVGPWPDNVKPAEVLQAQLSNIGLNVELRIISSPSWFVEHTGENWDIGINAQSITDPSGWANAFVCGNFDSNVTGYCNEQIAELAAQGSATSDQAARAEAYQGIANILMEDMPFLFIYATGATWAANDGIQGMKIPGDHRFEAWDFQDWTR
jgi:peptide/nickel transport system substrate-binding protein